MIGRWQGLRASAPAISDQQLRNELRRHREQIIEWLAKKRDAAVTISGHYKEIRRLKKEAAKRGIAL